MPPPHFRVVPLNNVELLRNCSHWTHTFMLELYRWIGCLAWPSSSENTGRVAWVELLASFKCFSGMNVPVKHPSVDKCFTMTLIHPLVQDLTPLNEELVRFQAAIKALQQILKQTLLPKVTSHQLATGLGYYFQGEFGTVHGRPWIPCFEKAQKCLAQYLGKLEGTRLHQPLQIDSDIEVKISPYDAILKARTHLLGFNVLLKKGRPPEQFAPFEEA